MIELPLMRQYLLLLLFKTHHLNRVGTFKSNNSLFQLRFKLIAPPLFFLINIITRGSNTGSPGYRIRIGEGSTQ